MKHEMYTALTSRSLILLKCRCGIELTAATEEEARKKHNARVKAAA
jgi:Mn-dependent DtxR family transcriptional regulator